MFAAALLLTLPTSGPTEAVRETARIVLRDDALRLGDIALVTSGKDVVVARLPQRSSKLSLTENQRRDLLEKRLPGRAVRLRHRGDLSVERGSESGETARLRGPCYAARVDLAAGAYVTRDDVAETQCTPGAVERRLRYDALVSAPLARETIPASTYLGRLRPVDHAPIAPGQAMLLRTSIGPVIIERTVTSLQPARHGRRIFVRTDDGKLLTSTLADVPEEKSK